MSHKCPTYFSLWPLVPINFWPIMAYVIVFSLDFSIFSIYCYHGLSSVVQSSSFIFSIIPWGFSDQLKKIFVQKCTFGGWIWPATLLGWFCDSYFLASLCSSMFSIIHFSRKWPSRMNNLYRKMPIFVQNRFNRFHHFSIGFTQMSNLLQPFAVGSNQCLAYFMVLSLDFSSCSIYWIFCNILPWLSSVVKSISSF